MESFIPNMPTWLTLTSAHSDSHDSNKLAPTTLTYSLSQLWQARSHNSVMLGLTAPTCSLLPVWQSDFTGSKLVGVDPASLVGVNLASLVGWIRLHWEGWNWLCSWQWIWLRWEQAGSSGYGFAGSRESGFTMSWHEALDLASLPQLWHAWPYHSDMLTLPSLRIWLRWEQDGSGGSSFAGRGEIGFARSKPVALDPALPVEVKLASLVRVDLTSLGASW